MKSNNNRGALQISFGWLFAIIVGAFILFLAIYGVTKLVGVQEQAIDAKTGKQIGSLLNPLETSFQSGRAVPIVFPVETRLENTCDTFEDFGHQKISVSQKSRNTWTDTDTRASFTNKYIFSEQYTTGKTFYLFSKPFNFPFKVNDMFFMTSSEDIYCFVDAPQDIKEEIETLSGVARNFVLDECSDEDIKVCFSSAEEDCPIRVNYAGKEVSKGQDVLHFVNDATMYAAIFSSEEIYDCQLKRLMQKVEILAQLYIDKGEVLERVGCGGSLNAELSLLAQTASNFESSANLNFIYNSGGVDAIDVTNSQNSLCRLW